MAHQQVIHNKTFDEIHIGDSAEITRTLSQDDIQLFGTATGDLNPTHYDSDYAEEIYQVKKIHGHSLWASSLVSGLLGNELPGMGTVYKNQAIEFQRGTTLGDSITVSITAIAKNDETKVVTFSCKGVNQRGEVVFTGEANVVAPSSKASHERVELSDVKLTRHHHVFNDLIERCQALNPVKVAVCHPCDQVSLEGPVEAFKQGIIEPILVGPEDKIRAVADQYNLDLAGIRILNTPHSHRSAEEAVALCRSGEAEALMKGSLHTDEMMHEVAARGTGLRTGRRISHVFVMDVPSYPKMLLITDAAVNIYPTLEDKRDICQNAIDMGQVLGVAEPKVAILSAVETVYPKIASTIDAAALCKMADRGQITGGILDGPLAFDNAISAEAAKIKKIKSPVAGNADILLTPDLEAGNMVAKQLSYLADAEAAGIVLGARVPIILTSRADSAKARLASCAVAALFAASRREGGVPAGE